MNATQRKPRVLIAAGSIIVVSALVLATAGLAAAQSRAANRWNHVGGGADAPTPALVAAAREDERVRVIRVHELFTDNFTFIDVGEPGDSPGDYGVFQDPLANPRTGTIVGAVDVQCIAAYADQCRGSIQLRGRGQITFDGITPLGVDPDRFALTGGTGEFKGAGGVLIVSFPAENIALLTVRITD